MYRPFVKKQLHYQKEIIERPGKFETYFGKENLAICVTGSGAKKEFSAIITNTIPNLNMLEAGTQVFLLKNNDADTLLSDKKGLSEEFSRELGLTDEDTFYYVYAVLHSPKYREKYGNDLKKSLPRIPILKQKEKFVSIGKKLAELHLNYENAESYKDIKIESKEDSPSYKVQKMKFIKKGCRDTIVFNSDIKISNIPERAHEYIISGRSAIEWIIDQYQVKVDKKSGIVDDPNKYSDDEMYIFNLLLSIINVSVQTVDLVNSLPSLELPGDA